MLGTAMKHAVSLSHELSKEGCRWIARVRCSGGLWLLSLRMHHSKSLIEFLCCPSMLYLDVESGDSRSCCDLVSRMIDLMYWDTEL